MLDADFHFRPATKIETHLYPATAERPTWGVLRLRAVDSLGNVCGTFTLFPQSAGDLDALIGQATRLRAELRQAEELALVEEAERQMEPHHEDEHADSAPHG